MNPARDHLRHERKLLPAGHALPEALALVHQHPAGFRETYPARWVNNLYLDSPGLTDYHQHVSGLPERSKSRIRWYGALRGPIPKPTFERKLKQGSLSAKRSRSLPPLAMNGGLGEPRLREMLREIGSDNPLRPLLDHRRPSLVNRYRRHYFLSADGRVRLTVDSELVFFAPEHTAEAMASPSPEKCAVVLELKYSPADAECAAEIANWFPCRVARCSKYVLGIEAIHRV